MDGSVGLVGVTEHGDGGQDTAGHGAAECVGDAEVALGVRREDADPYEALQVARRPDLEEPVEFVLWFLAILNSSVSMPASSAGLGAAISGCQRSQRSNARTTERSAFDSLGWPDARLSRCAERPDAGPEALGAVTLPAPRCSAGTADRRRMNGEPMSGCLTDAPC